jgi:hypothetical protein
MNRRTLVLAVMAGVVITLVTGIIPTEVLMGATHYGFPLSWLIRLALAPEYDPWRINIVNLIVDMTLWTATYLVVIYLFKRIRI